jgi:acetolactate synthase-1/3 small subunit
MTRYKVAVLVKNQFGVLNRVTSMFRRRQFNISALTVSETESNEFSRITVMFDGEENQKQQLINQLYKLPDVCSIKELTNENSVSCELLLIKMPNEQMSRDDILNGRLICQIGIAPSRPAEFVIFRVTQYTSEAGQAAE